MAKYTKSRPSQPSTPADESFTGDCLCPGCRRPLLAGEMIRQQAIYKCGELDYIALGHAECCPEYDNAEIPESDFELNPETTILFCCCGHVRCQLSDPERKLCSECGTRPTY